MKRKPYLVTIGGITHRMLLTDDAARQYGDSAKADTGKPDKADTPDTKATTPANKSGR